VENLPAVHRGRTRERIAARSTVLPVQDGTDLNLATHPRGQGLGMVGRNGNSEGMPGLHLHGTPAVAGDGIPIGLTRLEFDAPEPRPEASRGAAGPATSTCRCARSMTVHRVPARRACSRASARHPYRPG